MLNSYTTGYQGNAKLAAGRSGELIVAWESEGSFQDDRDVSIQARRFDLGIFEDGFESADTCAWSAEVGAALCLGG